ncbi:MAG: hypothetical protein ACE5K1_05635 [Acidiferrobacterales bacterium]
MKTKILLTLCTSMILAMPIVNADSPTIRVKCEKRDDRSKISDERSKISVDGKNLFGNRFSTEVMSGSNTATSSLQAPVGDEAEYDFDSAPDNIAAGAVLIPANFIQGGQVTGKILNEDGYTVVSDYVRCDTKD